jgi:hypothetical protein
LHLLKWIMDFLRSLRQYECEPSNGLTFTVNENRSADSSHPS